MASEIYRSPESNVSVSHELIDKQKPVFWVFDKAMLAAVAVLVLLAAALSGMSLTNQPEMSMRNVALGFAINVFWAFFTVYLIRVIRGNLKLPKKHLGVYETIGPFGYIWRALVTKYLSLLLIMIVLALFSLVSRLEVPSMAYTIVSLGAAIIVSIVITWLLFSTDRKGQFYWAMAIFRGY